MVGSAAISAYVPTTLCAGAWKIFAVMEAFLLCDAIERSDYAVQIFNHIRRVICDTDTWQTARIHWYCQGAGAAAPYRESAIVVGSVDQIQCRIQHVFLAGEQELQFEARLHFVV